jgi:hypothetical protein
MDIKQSLENIEYITFRRTKDKTMLLSKWYELKKTTIEDIRENKPLGCEVEHLDNKFRLITYI